MLHKRDYTPGKRGPLDGVPVFAKAIYDMNGLPTTASNAEWARLFPELVRRDAIEVARLRAAGLATADWSEGPDWRGLDEGRWIVKSALEDASVGLDDGCVVRGAEAVKARAAHSAAYSPAAPAPITATSISRATVRETAGEDAGIAGTVSGGARRAQWQDPASRGRGVRRLAPRLPRHVGRERLSTRSRWAGVSPRNRGFI